MRSKTSKTAVLVVAAATAASTTTVSGFAVRTRTQQSTMMTTTSLNGLFDGVKDAFSAPPSQLDSERETPIDRWMGWSTVSDSAASKSNAQPVDFVDSMDEKNYIAVQLTKPMGIVFEENDAEFGGIFVQSLKEGGVAAMNGMIAPGDQLVAVGTTNVSGMDFDDALGAIIGSEGDSTKLTLFRGTAKQFYGPTGPSKEWLAKFCEKGGVEVQVS